ncbi:MAG: 16S rRNA (guanine(527)-N(7))-methyltransferase RsmG [Bacilli bacterium]|nr:16S rRNA (guanine(527)-N(7))-methyltransferase RsmG [Bacilli bacterium]
MTKEEFIKALEELHINIDESKLEKLNKFYHLLIKWNEAINLTTIVKEEEVYLKHFYDSLTLEQVIDLNQDLKLLDVGTGAGFPGIVLKIVFPNLKITLLDSLNKRVNYLKEVIKELDLEDIEVECARAEDYSKEHIEVYDVVVSRAVAHLKILSEITFQSVKVHGYLIAMKGNIDIELAESQTMIKELNGKVVEINTFKLPKEESTRNLIKIEKLMPTNKKYPRKYSEIKKSLKRN